MDDGPARETMPVLPLPLPERMRNGTTPLAACVRQILERRESGEAPYGGHCHILR